MWDGQAYASERFDLRLTIDRPSGEQPQRAHERVAV
jgi:hypothetical protein